MKHLLLLLILPVAVLWAQDEPAPAPSDPAPAATAPAPPAGPGGGRQNNNDGEPRPYDRVITKEAKTQKGVFLVHQVRNRYYYEIPASELGKDFLWVSQIARTTIGSGNGGQPTATHVVRWERHDNRVLQRELNFEVTADPSQPIAKAVEAAANPAIIMSFNVEANGPENAAVIDVTRLFSSDVPEFSARTRLRARGMDASRSFIERITPFPNNIEAEATHTYTSPTDTNGPGGGGIRLAG